MAKAIILAFDLARIDDKRRADVSSRLPDWDILEKPSPDDLALRWNDVEIAAGGPLPSVLQKAPNLKWLQLGGAGADGAMRVLPDDPPVVTNASGVHAIPISEHLISLMIAFARDIHTSVRHQSQSIWNRRHTVFELAGKRVLLVGVGAIGNRFAASATALGMEVVAMRRHPDRGPGAAARVVSTSELYIEITQADFVVITTPLTAETRGLVDKKAIALMKPSAYIFNIGRGPIIDEPALVRALQEGRIAGAGLDVFDPEPPPPDSPLWSMENVIMTSHYAGLTPEYGDRLWAIFIDNLDRYLAGQPLNNIVDPTLGY